MSNTVLTETPGIAVKGLSKRFKGSDVFAVDNLSFECRPGEITGLLGENGAGKTTTLRMLSTMIKPTSGSAVICGYDVEKESSLVRRSIGVLFGGVTGLYDRLTARENILYFAGLNGVTDDIAVARLEELSLMLDMTEYIDRRTGTFSTGMLQKTAIARTLVHDPRVLLLDEPAAGLDMGSSRIIYDAINHYRNQGKTVILSSHDIGVASALCDNAVILHGGRSVAQGTMDEVIKGFSSLEDAFVEYTENRIHN
ncbi:MAG: ATP-binding cassette domain-containing protein [Spirochaetota bacterium]